MTTAIKAIKIIRCHECDTKLDIIKTTNQRFDIWKCKVHGEVLCGKLLASENN
tara:strand:+ start:1311 stop:1469 length:159 start_codon:yes stop_codon:yes gene_type:complete